jgi:hypothetical protein
MLVDCPSGNEGHPLSEQGAPSLYNLSIPSTAEAFFLPSPGLACSPVLARSDVRVLAHRRRVLGQAYSPDAPLSHVRSLRALEPWVPISPCFREAQRPAWTRPVANWRVPTSPASVLSEALIQSLPAFHETQSTWVPRFAQRRARTLPAWKPSARTLLRTSVPASVPSGLHSHGWRSSVRQTVVQQIVVQQIAVQQIVR